MRMWLWKCNEMFTKRSYRDVRIRYNRHVTRTNDPRTDNIVIIAEKNTTPEEDDFYEYPYYNARILKRFIITKRRWFIAKYQHQRFMVEELDNANRIHTFNWFKEEGHVESFWCCFRLVDLVCNTSYTLGTPTIQSWWLRSLFKLKWKIMEQKLDPIQEQRKQLVFMGKREHTAKVYRYKILPIQTNTLKYHMVQEIMTLCQML